MVEKAVSYFVAFVFTIVAITYASAGCSASSRSAAIDSSLVALNAARDGFIEWDKSHQETLVEQATSPADASARLAGYRSKRLAVLASFELGYTTIAVAAITVGDERDRNLIKAAGYLYRVYTLIRELMEGS